MPSDIQAADEFYGNVREFKFDPFVVNNSALGPINIPCNQPVYNSMKILQVLKG